MHDRMPTMDELGAWALDYFRDAPAITIGTNTDVQTYTSPLPRDGVKLSFPFAYLYELRKSHLAVTAATRA